MIPLNFKSTEKVGRKVTNDLYCFFENPMLDCNQYIVSDKNSGDLTLFDAGNGLSLEGLFQGMKKLNLDYRKISKVFLTHEHVDHVLGLYPLMEKFLENPPDILAYIETANILNEGKESKILPTNLGITASMLGVNIKPLDVKPLSNGENIIIGTDFRFEVLFTPGHSQGSICFYEPEKRILIPGDLVFIGGSFGRYDFPGGSLKKLIESIKFVSDLDVKYLLPGHMGISDEGTRNIQESFRMVQSFGSFF